MAGFIVFEEIGSKVCDEEHAKWKLSQQLLAFMLTKLIFMHTGNF